MREIRDAEGSREVGVGRELDAVLTRHDDARAVDRLSRLGVEHDSRDAAVANRGLGWLGERRCFGFVRRGRRLAASDGLETRWSARWVVTVARSFGSRSSRLEFVRIDGVVGADVERHVQDRRAERERDDGETDPWFHARGSRIAAAR
jgi:hypothetical protein